MSYLDFFCELLKQKFLKTDYIHEDEIEDFKLIDMTKNFYQNMSDKTMKEYKVKPDAPMKDKFNVLKRMANKYDRVLQRNTKNATGKKDLQEMKT